MVDEVLERCLHRQPKERCFPANQRSAAASRWSNRPSVEIHSAVIASQIQTMWPEWDRFPPG